MRNDDEERPVQPKVGMEPATGIEPTTRGLRTQISTITTPLTPQETTTSDSGTVNAEGAGLSCPGSSVVAENEESQLFH
jgi:hypothetical protein